MIHDTRQWELEMKADRVLYRLSVDQIAYLGDGFPWPVTDEDLADRSLVDRERQFALGLGYRAANVAAAHFPE